MRNVFRVFGRDVARVAKTPAAWLVALFLIVLPSLYAWFNVVGFWNPYENTSHLRICVVNEDSGAHDDTLGDLDLGAQIIDQLHEDNQLGWDFVSRDEAMNAVESGEAYAAFVIPEDFSSDMATILTANFQAPELEYYVNEKAGPVAPKITDTGATTLDNTINDTFVSTASETVAKGIDEWIGDSKADLKAAQSSTLDKIQEATDDITTARASLKELSDTATEAKDKLQNTKETLATTKIQAQLLADSLGDVSALTGEATSGIVMFSTSTGTVLDDGSRLLSKASAQTTSAVSSTSTTISQAQSDVDSALKRAQNIVSTGDAAIKTMDELVGILPDGKIKQDLEQKNQKLKDTNAQAHKKLDTLQTLSTDIGNTAQSIDDTVKSTDTALQTTLTNIDEFRTGFSSESVPALSKNLSKITSSTHDLSTTVSGQLVLIDQTMSLVDELSSTLDISHDAMSQTDDVLAQIQSDFDSTATDIRALGSSESLKNIFGEEINQQNVADFMMSPTTVETEKLYPLNAYGSAMAPLFINLTLWIGAFMLMVIMRVEVDSEGIPNPKPWQLYLGRWLLLACMVAMQAAVCVAGCLVIGVQTVSAPAFFITAIGASLAYLSIQYALSSSLQHVGMGLCIILVFIQIPAATGLYPIEMTTDFFHAVYPAFPFTYGIGAIREVIGGFYDGTWIHDMSVLGVIMVVFVALGVVARPYVANLNRLFARQLEESDLINTESVELPERHYRITQIIRVLSDREEYRHAIKARAERFVRLYPRLKRGALIFGVAVPAIAMTVLSVQQAEKVVMLTVLLIWYVVLVSFLVIVEYIRASIIRQIDLESFTNDEVLVLYSDQKHHRHTFNVKHPKTDEGSQDENSPQMEQPNANPQSEAQTNLNNESAQDEESSDLQAKPAEDKVSLDTHSKPADETDAPAALPADTDTKGGAR